MSYRHMFLIWREDFEACGVRMLIDVNAKPIRYKKLLKQLHDICRPNGAVVTRLTRNEKIIGSIPILGI